MEKEFTHLDLFDQYIQEAMSPEEKADFEKRLSKDEVFRQEFDLYQDMVISIDYASEQDMRATISGVQEKLAGEQFFESHDSAKVIDATRRFKFSTRRWLSIAAGFLIIVAAAVFFFNRNTGDGLEAAFAEYYQPESEYLSNTLNRLESTGFADIEGQKNKALANALTHFEKADYSEAKTALTSYLEQYPGDPFAQLYLGLTHLELSEYAQTIGQLESIPEGVDSGFMSVKKWYLALAYTQIITAESGEKARTLLNQLAAGNGRYAEQARAFLQEIE